MGPPLGCRCRLAACALGSRGILKRESRQSADRCVQVTILPIEHSEWNTRFASILVSTRGSAKDQRGHKDAGIYTLTTPDPQALDHARAAAAARHRRSV